MFKKLFDLMGTGLAWVWRLLGVALVWGAKALLGLVKVSVGLVVGVFCLVVLAAVTQLAGRWWRGRQARGA